MTMQDTPMNGFGTSTSTDRGPGPTSSPRSTPSVCPTCGHVETVNSGLEQFLGRLGISDDMIEELKTSFQKVDLDEYLDTAPDYLNEPREKASMLAMQNPRKAVTGV